MTRISAYASTVVNAPPETVWATVIDIDANPSNISAVDSVERIDGSKTGDAVATGTRWKETRVYKGNAVAQTKTISLLGYEGERRDHDDDDESSAEPRKDPLWPRSFSLAITYDAPFEGVCNTSTLTVQPYHGGNDSHPGGTNDGTAHGNASSSRSGDGSEKGSAAMTLLSGTCAAVPSRLRHKIAFSLGRCSIVRRRKNPQHDELFQQEIDELASAAERRVAAATAEEEMPDEA